ncbi:hypothetical protein MBLNU457_7639t1 [Dothideomycetes sp. NU457]
MFCTSLRRRRSLPNIVAALQSSPDFQCRENELKTCDLNVPIEFQSRREPSASRGRHVRLLIYSTISVTQSRLAKTVERIEHLASISGEDAIAIIFSLQQPAAQLAGQDEVLSPTLGLAKLQAELLMSTSLPAIPVLLVQDFRELISLIKTHCIALSRPAKSIVTPKAIDLLPLCSTGQPLDGFATALTSDLFRSLKDLAATMVSSGEEDYCETIHRWDVASSNAQDSGSRRDVLEGQLDQDVMAAMMNFWKEEYIVE